jgi:cytochrome c2
VRALWPTRFALVAAAAALVPALLAAGCGREGDPDLVNGRALYVQKCGQCHALKRAGTQGKTGPDLDVAFAAALRSGMNRETVRGVVHDQIGNVRKGSQMPEDLVKGNDARDVAAYVGFASNRPGEDEGALAQAGLEDATSGEQIFVAAGCGGCHTLGKAGTNSSTGPNLNELRQSAQRFGREQNQTPEEYVQQSILEPDAFTVPGFQRGVMPPYEGRMNRKQIQALTEYLLGE